MNHDEFERQQANWARRAQESTGAAATAFEHLLVVAETGSSGQARTVARILAGLYNGQDFPIDPYELRGLDIALSDAVLACLDGLRWGKQDIHTLVPSGDARTRAVLERHGIEWPNAN